MVSSSLLPSIPGLTTLLWSAGATGEAAVEIEVAAPKAKPAVRRNKGKAAVDRKGTNGKTKRSADVAPVDGGSTDMIVGLKPKPKRPRKPRKKAQPPAGSHAPALCAPDVEWQALWTGPPSLFPGPAASSLGD